MLTQAIYITSVGILSIRIRALPDAFSEIDDVTPHFLFIIICHNTEESNGIQIHDAMGEGKYLNLWRRKLSIILSAIEKGRAKEPLPAEEFKQSGNRKFYGFRLDISNGIVPIKSSSAVARDLKIVLDESSKFKEISQNKKNYDSDGSGVYFNCRSTRIIISNSKHLFTFKFNQNIV